MLSSGRRRVRWRRRSQWRPATGAEAFLAAVASGNVKAVAQELHPDEVEKLRTRLLALLRAEASRTDNTYRSRLFGPGRSLADLESMTAVRFYAALSDRLRFRAREYEKFDWLAAVPDGKVVYLVGKGIQPKDRGSVKVARDGGARRSTARSGAPSIPSEVEAQLDDLIEGRAAAAPPPSGGAPGGRSWTRGPHRWLPASANCWRAPKPASRRATARSTTANS